MPVRGGGIRLLGLIWQPRNAGGGSLRLPLAGLGAVQTRRGTALPAASVPVSRRSTRCSKVRRRAKGARARGLSRAGLAQGWECLAEATPFSPRSSHPGSQPCRLQHREARGEPEEAGSARRRRPPPLPPSRRAAPCPALPSAGAPHAGGSSCGSGTEDHCVYQWRRRVWHQ